MVGKQNLLLTVLVVSSFFLTSLVKSTTGRSIAAAGQKGGLFMNKVRSDKVEGEYHSPSRCIQFLSEVRDDDQVITVTTTEGEPVVIMRKPERASMMTVKMGLTKFLVQMNEPGSGLPRYSDYVVPRELHNLMDSVLTQNFHTPCTYPAA